MILIMSLMTIFDINYCGLKFHVYKIVSNLVYKQRITFNYISPNEIKTKIKEIDSLKLSKKSLQN